MKLLELKTTNLYKRNALNYLIFITIPLNNVIPIYRNSIALQCKLAIDCKTIPTDEPIYKVE